MKMTPERIAETRELIAKATAGPWKSSSLNWRGEPAGFKLHVSGNHYRDGDGTTGTGVCIVEGNSTSTVVTKANADFITNARTSLPDALDDLDSLSQQLAAVTAERDALRLKVNPVYLDVEKYYEDDPHQATNVQCSTPAAGEKETNP
jgi:hypothetical protein